MSGDAGWKTLAISIANQQGVPVPIVLATVDAETGGKNQIGDNGNSYGYGQVQPKYYNSVFIWACNQLGLVWPSDIPSQQQLILSNQTLSMLVAVNVIGQVWTASKGNWNTFTTSYVGSGVSQIVVNTRYAIWQQYNNSTYDSYTTTNAPANAQQTQTDKPASQTSPNSSPVADIPTSNFQVVTDSMKTGYTLYGRRYRLFVEYGDKKLKAKPSIDLSQMRCVFKIKKNIVASLNLLEVSVYNLNAETENALMKTGSRVVIEAGYEGQQYGMLFDGDIVWTNREKENGTTYKLTIYALDGMNFTSNAIVNYSLSRGQTARTQAQNIVSQASIPNVLSQVPSTFDNAQLTRGKVFFGLAHDYLDRLAHSQKATYYLQDGKVNFIKADALPDGTIFDLNSQSGLIGTPAQNEDGITFTALLNPLFMPLAIVHIDNSLIRAVNYTGSTSTVQTIRGVDNDGIYRVIESNFIGDTRGNDWYVECQCVTQAGKLPSLAQTSSSAVMT